MQLALVGSAPAELLVAGPAGEPRGLLGDYDGRELGLAVLAHAGLGDNRNTRRDVGAAVRDPLFRAVYDPSVALGLGGGLGAAGVGAGVLFRQPERPEGPARGAPGEVPPLLLGRPVGCQRGASEGDVGLHRDPDGGVRARDLLERHVVADK